MCIFFFFFVFFDGSLNYKKKPFKLAFIVFFQMHMESTLEGFWAKIVCFLYLQSSWMMWDLNPLNEMKVQESFIIHFHLNEWMMHYNGWIIPHWWMNFMFVLCPQCNNINFDEWPNVKFIPFVEYDLKYYFIHEFHWINGWIASHKFLQMKI